MAETGKKDIRSIGNKNNIIIITKNIKDTGGTVWKMRKNNVFNFFTIRGGCE